ncbi:MAG: tRNA (adenosine(37)-N6)-threonylcarbamoyltransferase complex dimerization subunit type 1 TsaB [Kineosporiaceae bacterium]
MGSVLLLALDTSGAQVCAALHDGRRVIAERCSADPRHHAELLAPAIVAILDEAGASRSDLSGIAVGVGPGPFTGLRVGLVTAEVLGHALGIPVYGVGSLDALAEAVAASAGAVAGGPASGGPAGAEFIVTGDARRRDVHWARYRAVPRPGGAAAAAQRLDGPHVQAPDGPGGLGLPVFGRGALVHAEAFPTRVEVPPDGPGPDVTAGQVATLAAGALTGDRPDGAVGLLPVEPLYLRRPDAVEPSGRKRVRPAPAG